MHRTLSDLDHFQSFYFEQQGLILIVKRKNRVVGTCAVG